jgi:hypothetical protein
VSDRIILSLSKRAVRNGAVVLGAAGLVVVGYVAGVRAAIPSDANALTYSGVLEENGTLVDGTRAVSVSIFDDPTTGQGNLLCGPVNDPSTPVAAGRFAIPLPAACAAALRANATAFVEVDVAGVPVGNRTAIGAVPFSIEAGHAALADVATDVASLPSGAVMAFDLAACPTGWSDFSAASGRAIVGDGQGSGLTNHTLDQQFGAETHTLTVAEMPAHNHGGQTTSLGAGGGASDFIDYLAGSGETGMATTSVASGTTRLNSIAYGIPSEGSSQPHSIVPPSIALHFCKKS